MPHKTRLKVNRYLSSPIHQEIRIHKRERPTNNKPFVQVEQFEGNGRPRSLESEILDGKEIGVNRLAKILEDLDVEVVGRQRAAGV